MKTYLGPRRLIMPVESGKTVAASNSTHISLATGANGYAYKQVDILLRKTNATTFWTDANIDSHLEMAYLRLNGRTIWELSGSELMDLMGYDRPITADKGVIPFRFGQLDSRTIEGEDDGIMGTADVDTLDIELKWDATFALATPLLDVVATVQPNENLGMYHSYRRYNPSFTGATRQIWEGLKLTEDMALAAIHVKNANISDVEVALGDKTILEGKRYHLEHELREYEKVPNSAWTHLDFTKMHRHGHALPLGGTIRVANTYSVDPAGAVVHVVKAIETYRR